jgi:hypothetical protein
MEIKMNVSDKFIKYVDRALKSVSDVELASCLRYGFECNLELLAQYVDHYSVITARDYGATELRRFFCTWRSPDGAAHAVSSIIIRLLRTAKQTVDVHARERLLEAAWHCGEIIVEDVGLGEMHGHPHHSKLYTQLATVACGSEAWRMQDEYAVPAARSFSEWVGDKRPRAPDLTEAIEMMIMTELFNTAEYNIMTPMWKDWFVTARGLDKRDANKAAAFLSVHCGPVEAKHFFHATSALELYAQGVGAGLEYERIRSLSANYVVRACDHLAVMMNETLGIEARHKVARTVEYS